MYKIASSKNFPLQSLTGEIDNVGGTAGTPKYVDNQSGCIILWKQSLTSASPKYIVVSRVNVFQAALSDVIPSGISISIRAKPSGSTWQLQGDPEKPD